MIFNIESIVPNNMIKHSDVKINYNQSSNTANKNLLYISRHFVESQKLTLLEKIKVNFEINIYDKELCTRKIDDVDENELLHIDLDGFPIIGQKIQPGKIIVGITRPKYKHEMSPEERLLQSIFGEKATNTINTSIVNVDYIEAIVYGVEKTKNDKGDIIGGNITLCIYLPISVGAA